MTNGWRQREDRVLGYVGLFLIGSLSWLADHVGAGLFAAPGSRRRSTPPSARKVAGPPTIARPESLGGRRAA
jgi:hypothetical protein